MKLPDNPVQARPTNQKFTSSNTRVKRLEVQAVLEVQEAVVPEVLVDYSNVS